MYWDVLGMYLGAMEGSRADRITKESALHLVADQVLSSIAPESAIEVIV